MEEAEKVKCLPENRFQALRDLHINPTHKLKRDESPAFLLYLNYAVNNIRDITNISKDTSSNGIETTLRDKTPDEALRKLANFFWLFAVDDPMRDYPDYKKYTIAIAKKIYELRDYFAHIKDTGSAPLTVDTELYRFISGVLGGQALEHSVLPGLQTSKLFKMKLFAVKDRKAGTWNFTRRGLIFLICIALYRDDAYEFTQCLEDMKLPTCPKGKDADEECSCECVDIASCKPGVAKAFVAMFTYFSARRGRSVNLLQDDLNYMSFADISGYLNKAPAEAITYLTLEKENSMLQEKRASSTESEENKVYKYTIHKRFQDRFLSFAAGYLEDFNTWPSIRFKRLDISNHEGRKRYFFGKEHDNRVHMNRHYEIKNGAIRFEWIPRKHYGDIHIDSLRSAMSAAAMKEMLYAVFAKENVKDYIDKYFTAYHRLLETLLNTSDHNDIYLRGSLLEDAAVIANCKPEILEEDIEPLERFLPENILRFFIWDESLPGDKELRKALQKRLKYLQSAADDFCTRMNKLNAWRKELSKLREKDPDASLPKPVCSNKEVANPPYSCCMSDAKLINWVFRFFNLHLDNDQKFRQLPRGEQHRGVIDYEYQWVHSLIGKYSLDPQGLKKYIADKKQVLLPAWNALTAQIKILQEKASENMPVKVNRYGKKVLPAATLGMLAQAAAICYGKYCKDKLALLDNPFGYQSGKLRTLCRKFGIKTGMPLDRAALIKTILGIDLATWMKAYDPETGANFENRSLSDKGHIVSQIPFPNDFAQRIMLASPKPKMQQLIRHEEGKADVFDFNTAFRQMETQIQARDFYDTAPLVAASCAVKTNGDLSGIPGLRTQSGENENAIDFSRSAIRKAVANIKESCNQDKILLNIAQRYWDEFQNQGAFTCDKKLSPQLAEKVSIYEYFDAGVLLSFPEKGKRSIRIMPNDVNRPILSQIQDYAADIAAYMDPSGEQQEFDFYEMLKAYRIIQTKDRALRLELIPLLNEFDNAVDIPRERYVTGGDNRTMEFAFFRQKFPALSRQEFDRIVDLRDAVFHRGVNLQAGGIKELLLKYVSPPKQALPKKPYWAKNRNYSYNKK